MLQITLVTLVREQKVEAVKRGHALKNPHVGPIPPLELTSEKFPKEMGQLVKLIHPSRPFKLHSAAWRILVIGRLAAVD